MSIYKECAICGTYGYEFTSATAYKIGRAVAFLKEEKEVLVCGDSRPSTKEIKEKLIEGLVTGGVKVYDMGIAPTSVFNFAKEHFGLPIGIMVTAGHEVPNINGFKIIYGNMPINDSEIQKIRSTIEKANFPFFHGSIKKLTDYKKEYLRDVFMKVKKGSLKIVMDCKYATTMDYAPAILGALGHEVIKINCEPNHELPSNVFDFSMESLSELKESVVATEAQMGVAFSTDGGRVAFLDEKGNLISSEQVTGFLMSEYAKLGEVLVVYDENSSDIIKKAGEKLGVNTMGGKNAVLKQTFIEENATLALGEGGHFYFKEIGYDDGMFAVAKVAQFLDTDTIPLSEISKEV